MMDVYPRDMRVRRYIGMLISGSLGLQFSGVLKIFGADLSSISIGGWPVLYLFGLGGSVWIFVGLWRHKFQ